MCNLEFITGPSATKPSNQSLMDLFFVSFSLSDDPSLSTLEALKTRIRDLEKQFTRGDRFKCLICMVSLSLLFTYLFKKE